MEKYLLASEIVFDSKPDAVPYNYRISYKIAQICLIIGKSCSSNAGCSLVKIHIIANAMNTKESMEELEDYINGKKSYIIVRFDPAINRAINFALTDKLVCQIKNGSFKLTEKGKNFLKSIEKEEVLVNEKICLNNLGKRLTKEKIESLMSLWRCKDVKD